jgi:hypothetical protein
MNNQASNLTLVFQRLQQWYESECNGDWEHSFGVKIETLDNPGWVVTIDLTETEWDSLAVERKIFERNDRDWVQYEVVNGQFVGCGGPGNLCEVVSLFFQVIDG